MVHAWQPEATWLHLLLEVGQIHQEGEADGAKGGGPEGTGTVNSSPGLYLQPALYGCIVVFIEALPLSNK